MVVSYAALWITHKNVGFFPFDVCGSFFDKSSIWALNINVLNEKVINDYLLENHTNVIAGDDLAKLIYDKATKDINSRFACKNSKDEYLYVTRPLLSNERINRQQGLFVIPSSINVGFDEILKCYYDSNLVYNMKFEDVVRLTDENRYGQQAISVLKIEIPKRLKYGLSNLLSQMNITSETMYPGLDGLARSMSCLRDSLGDYNAD